MQNRHDIITSMCYTSRHDYGLVKLDDEISISSGMTEKERKFLYDEMAQLYDNCIAPYMEVKKPRRDTHSCDTPGCAVCDPTSGL